MNILVGIWSFLVVSAYVPGISSGASAGRWAALGVGAAVLLLIVGRLRPTRSHWIGLALLAWMALGSSLWAVSGWDAWGETLRWVAGAAVFCVAAELDDLEPMWIGAGLGVTLSSVFSVVQLAGWQPVWNVFDNGAPGLLLAKNMAAETGAIVVVGLIGVAVRRPLAWLLLPGAVITSGVLSLTPSVVSRESLLAFLVVGLFWAWRAGRLLGAVLSLHLALVLGGVTVLGFIDPLSDRLQIWSVIVPNVNLFGDGLGATAVALPSVEFAHSEYVQYAFELGVGSLLLWWLLGRSLSCRGSVWDRAALAALLAQCAVWFPLHAPATLFLGAVLAGHLASAGRRAVSAGDPRRILRPERALDDWDTGYDYLGAGSVRLHVSTGQERKMVTRTILSKVRRGAIATLAVLSAAVSVSPAVAQSGGSQWYSAFFLTARVADVAANGTSQTVPLGLPFGSSVSVLRACNTSLFYAYASVGSSSVTSSPSTSVPLPPQTCSSLLASTATYVALVTDGEPALIKISLGFGEP